MTSTTDGAFERTALIAGNWKMNMDHTQAIALVQKLAWGLKDAKHDFARVEVAVFPPFTDLRSVQSLVEGDGLQVRYGAQDLSEQDSGAYTGDVSGQFLAKLGCTYALVGHSERRIIHEETDEMCRDTVRAAVRHNLQTLGRECGTGQLGEVTGTTDAERQEVVVRLIQDRVVILATPTAEQSHDVQLVTPPQPVPNATVWVSRPGSAKVLPRYVVDVIISGPIAQTVRALS